MATDFTHLIELAFEEDFSTLGDITSLATISSDTVICARITAKAAGVIAGVDVIAQAYHMIDPSLVVNVFIADGEPVAPKTVIAEISGSAQKILAGERTVINFLQHMSGIATFTRRFVDAVAHTQAVILDTRKTTPAWRKLEKYAVQMGGGQNHRLGLFDMVLIKDNHIDSAGSITAAVEAVRHYPDAKDLQIEVEVKDETELKEALALQVDRILLDNMTTEEMTHCVQITDGRIPLEASGNVSLETVKAIAETGVDYISIGALTHSAPSLDLSMRLVVE